jgi:hypothetical protein
MRLVTSGDTYLQKGPAMIRALRACFVGSPWILTNPNDDATLYIGGYHNDPQFSIFTITVAQGGNQLWISSPTTNTVAITVFDENGLTDEGSKLFKILGYQSDGSGGLTYKLGTYVTGYETNVISIHARGNSGIFVMALSNDKAVGSCRTKSGLQDYFINGACNGSDFYGEVLTSPGSSLYYSPIMIPSTNVVSAVDNNGYCIMPLVFSYGSDKVDNAYIAYGNPAGPTSSGYVTMDGHGFAVHNSPWGDSYNMIFIGDPDKV